MKAIISLPRTAWLSPQHTYFIYLHILVVDYSNFHYYPILPEQTGRGLLQVPLITSDDVNSFQPETASTTKCHFLSMSEITSSSETIW